MNSKKDLAVDQGLLQLNILLISFKIARHNVV